MPVGGGAEYTNVISANLPVYLSLLCLNLQLHL